MINFLKKNKAILTILILFTLSTVFFSSNYLFNWDAGQFALGTENFDLSKHQPHPPGYFLFIYGAKALNFLTNNINLSFLIINFIAGALAVYFLFKLILLISQSKKTSFIISLLFIVNPVFWFYHNIANTYTFEALAVILTAFFTYKAFLGHKNTLLINLGALAVLIGFRPSIIIAILPLLIIQFIFIKKKIKNLLLGALIFLILFGAWFIPFSKIIGFEEIISITKSQLFQSSANSSQKTQLAFLVKSLIFSFNIFLLLLIPFLKKNIKFIIEKKLYLFLIPAFLSCLFYVLIHIGEVGYILSVIPLFYLFIIFPVKQLLQKTWGIVFIILFLTAQVPVFLFSQTIFNDNKIEKINYSAITQHDQRIKNYTKFIKQQNPDESLILILRGQYFDENKNVGFYQYQDIRVLAYYLPEYKLFDFPGITSEYIEIKNFNTKKVLTNQIQISRNVKNIYIIADYIHPIDYPDEFILSAQTIPDSELLYYTGSMENINKFEFKGYFYYK